MRLRAVLPIALFCATFQGCRDNSRAGEIGTFQMGERAQIGPLIYTVLDTQWMVSLGEGAAARIPKDRFLLVDVNVVNGGGEALSIPSMNLVDDTGHSYPESQNGEDVPQWLPFVRKIPPVEPAQGNILFDVPQKHFRLKVTDADEQHYGFIDIPLTFGTPPPKADSPSPN